METGDRSGGTGVIRAALFYGSLWGLAEATLGFVLHLIPVSGLSGMVLFPVGFSLMIASYRGSGKGAAMLLTAVVAAAIKTSSLLLPVVTFPFVRNPVLAILLEGLVSFAAVRSLGLARGLPLVPQTLAVSVVWRGLFLLVNLGLGIRDGILSKGTGALVQYLALEPVVNTVLIAAIFAVVSAARTGGRIRLPRPGVAIVALVCVAALAGELGLAAL